MRMRSLFWALPLGLLLLGAGPQPADRDRALSALNAARNAAKQLEEGAGSAEARTHLAEAEAHFAAGEYDDAAEHADEAWRLMSSGSNAQGTKFRVEVDEGGKTKVSARSGGAVRVEARGVERTVEAGEELQVAPGEVPSEPRVPVPPPRPPQAALPADDAVLRLRPDKEGRLGPVRLSWKRTEGARGYLVELVPEGDAGAEPMMLRTTGASVELPRLAPGAYRWSVRAVGAEDSASEATAPRRFRLEVETMKLDVVRGTGWK